MASASQDVIHLDGTTLEGGGQLLRLALALSSLTHVPIHITDIRGNRGSSSRKGKDGGMKQAHLVGAQWLEAVTNAAVEGMEHKSRELVFKPNASISKPSATQAKSPIVEKDSGGHSWKYIYEGSKLVRKDARIAMTTPGSIFLVLQAVLPWIIFCSSRTEAPGTTQDAIPVRLTIIGGTNVWHSPSYEYMEQVLFPMLHEKLGLGLVKMRLIRRGWSHGTNSIGEIVFDITPLPSGAVLPAFSFQSRGELSKIHVSILGPNPKFQGQIKHTVTKRLLHHYPDTEIEFPVDGSSGHDKRMYLLLVAETTNGYRLGHDWLFDDKLDKQNPQKSIDRLVERVVKGLGLELEHGGCVDEYLEDQLVVFQTLCKGRSIVDSGIQSLHTRTARYVAEKLTGVRFHEDGACDGVSFVAGQQTNH